MSALEQEILEKFHQLQPEAKQRVRALIAQEVDAETEDEPEFDFDTWMKEVEALRAEIIATRDPNLPPIDVVAMVRELRYGEDE